MDDRPRVRSDLKDPSINVRFIRRHRRRRVDTFCVRSAIAPAGVEVVQLERGDERRGFGGSPTLAHVPQGSGGLTGGRRRLRRRRLEHAA